MNVLMNVYMHNYMIEMCRSASVYSSQIQPVRQISKVCLPLYIIHDVIIRSLQLLFEPPSNLTMMWRYSSTSL